MIFGFAYVIATVLFVIAGVKGGIDSEYADLVAFGLAFFSLGHIYPSFYPDGRP